MLDYGEAMTEYSYNGWSASPNLAIRPLVVSGESFSPGIRDDDDVFTVLQHLALQLDERVEPIVRADWHQADDWGFNYRPTTGGGSLSNHASGTAIDYNATRHPYNVAASANFTSAQIREIHKILNEIVDDSDARVLAWGGDYQSHPDAMHFEVAANKTRVAQAARRIKEMDMALSPEDKKWVKDQIKAEGQATRQFIAKRNAAWLERFKTLDEAIAAALEEEG